MAGYVVYCNTDEDGNITNGCWGINIIPDRQYDHFFYLNEPVDLMHCKVKYDGCKPLLIQNIYD